MSSRIRLSLRELEDRAMPATLLSVTSLLALQHIPAIVSPPAPDPTTTSAPATVTETYSDGILDANLSATVVSPDGVVNGGTITFTILEGTTVIGSPVTTTVGSGAASVSYPIPAGTAAGNYTYEVTYNGSTSFAASPAITPVLVICPAATTISTNSITVTNFYPSQGVTLTAGVTSAAGTVNSGTVTFTLRQGTLTVGTPMTVPVGNFFGASMAEAEYHLPSNAIGTYTIVAIYNGTANYATSSNTTHTVSIPNGAVPGWNGGTGIGIGAEDPNDLHGPVGVGPRNLTNPNQDWSYNVEFENDGTGAATDIVVSGRLDPSLDPASFQFEGADFGSAHVAVPAGVTSYDTVVAYHNADGSPLNVPVQFSYDLKTGEYSVRFGSVDSATGLPLGNGLEGVLPPDNASHIGVGNVLFSARPKPGLKDGTAISESVTVVFNTNAPDPTPTVTNIVDACMPLEKGTHGIVTFDVKSSEGAARFLEPLAVPATNAASDQSINPIIALDPSVNKIANIASSASQQELPDSAPSSRADQAFDADINGVYVG